MPKLGPANIETFMANNVVKAPTNINNNDIPYASRLNKTVWAELDPAFPSVMANGKGAVYALSFVPAEERTDQSFLIYWVEYQANGDGVATWLGEEAVLMFTAIMSGCTFGLGSATLEGVRAAHVNSMSKSQSGTPDHAQLQDQRDKLDRLGLVNKLITPDIYIPGEFDPDVKTTPFGFRPQLSESAVPHKRGIRNIPGMSLPWKFCWQKFRVVGRDVTHLGVAQHAGGLF